MVTTSAGGQALTGAPEDFDTWAYLGADGWSWEDVLPVYERIERRDHEAWLLAENAAAAAEIDDVAAVRAARKAHRESVDNTTSSRSIE